MLYGIIPLNIYMQRIYIIMKEGKKKKKIKKREKQKKNEGFFKKECLSEKPS